jgi:hypothetical protein
MYILMRETGELLAGQVLMHVCVCMCGYVNIYTDIHVCIYLCMRQVRSSPPAFVRVHVCVGM